MYDNWNVTRISALQKKVKSIWNSNEKDERAQEKRENLFFVKIKRSYTQLFKRGASKAAEGCLASVAAKLVKTATKILFANFQTYIRMKINRAGKFGPFCWIFVRSLKWLPNTLWLKKMVSKPLAASLNSALELQNIEFFK